MLEIKDQELKEKMRGRPWAKRARCRGGGREV